MGTLAFLAIVTTAFRLLLGVVKVGETAKLLAVIVCIVILLILLLSICIEAWYALSLWQKIGLVALGITALWLMQSAKRSMLHRRRK